MQQRVQTIDGQEIELGEDLDAWPLVNGLRVDAIRFPDAPHQSLITLILGDETFCLPYTVYCRALQIHYAASPKT